MADLTNVVNEAALLTARENKTVITAEALEEAVDRVVGGPRRKSHIISEHEKKVVVYHEGGHTLAAWAMPDLDPIYKVTIPARGRTGGHALAVPGAGQGPDDLLGDDRAAGQGRRVGGPPRNWSSRNPPPAHPATSTRATKIARAMVTEYGMSARLGAVRYGHDPARSVPGPVDGCAVRILHRGGPRDR